MFYFYSDEAYFHTTANSHLTYSVKNLNDLLIIPPVYEVYRGYIVFAFPFLCVCVNFFSSKISQELLCLGF